MAINFKGGFLNPFNLSKANYCFEVLEDKNEVRWINYEDSDGPHSDPEKDVLIQSLSGGGYLGNQWLVTLILDDAFKVLRPGEIISIELSYCVRKDEKGNVVQKVNGRNLYTLNDYFKAKEAESFYQGTTSKKKEDSDM